MAARHEFYNHYKLRNPDCWSGNTRDRPRLQIGVVTLNPERDSLAKIAAAAQDTQQKTA